MASYIGAIDSGPGIQAPAVGTTIESGTFHHTDAADRAATKTPLSYIKFPTINTGVIEYFESDVSQWSLADTDVHASATKWAGLVWYDSINDILWLSAYVTATTMQLASVDVQTGVVTAMPSITTVVNTLFATNGYNICTQRPAENSGDFTFYLYDHQYIISSTTGLLVSETPDIRSLYESGYVTWDGKFSIIGTRVNGSDFYVVIETVSSATAEHTTLAIDLEDTGMIKSGIYNAATTNRFSYFNWGSEVISLCPFVSIGTPTSPYRMNRASFDTWVLNIANNLGLKVPA